MKMLLLAGSLTSTSGYNRSLLGGNQVLNQVGQKELLILEVQAQLNDPAPISICSTHSMGMKDRGIDFLLLCRGIVISIDSMDIPGKMESRTAQVFVSQADADSSFHLAAVEIARLIRLNLSHTPSARGLVRIPIQGLA